MTVTEHKIETARCHMAALFRLLSHFEMNEGIDNHCSFVLPDQTILVNKQGVLWSQMTKSDILRFDSTGQILNGNGAIEPTAFHLHEAIHRLCPHAKAVLHTHIPYATTITCLEGGKLEPISQNALRFYGRIAYDNNYGGLASNRNEGERIAEKIGNNLVLMLGNHGVIVVGKSIGLAFNDLYFLEKSAMIQILGASTGQPFRKIKKEVMELTAAQWATQDEHNKLFFEALLAVLNKKEPEYKS